MTVLLVVLIVGALVALSYANRYQCPHCLKPVPPRWDYPNKRGGPDRRRIENVQRCPNCGYVVRVYSKATLPRTFTRTVAQKGERPRPVTAAAGPRATEPPRPIPPRPPRAALPVAFEDTLIHWAKTSPLPWLSSLRRQWLQWRFRRGFLERRVFEAQIIALTRATALMPYAGPAETADPAHSPIELKPSVPMPPPSHVTDALGNGATVASVAAVGASTLETTTRMPIEATQVQLLHRKMQQELIQCLRVEKAAHRNLFSEREGIDILVEDLDDQGLVQRTYIIEVKTGESAKGAIRDALGQVLEYRFFNRKMIKTNKPILVIVSPFEADRMCQDYISFLRDRYKLPLVYKQYVPGSMRFILRDMQP